MPLKIWHQSFTTLKDVPAYRDALRSQLASIVRPDTEIVLHGQIPGTYSTDYPGVDLAYTALFTMHGLQWIAAAREAERQGFDAVVFATMSNPLIHEIRTLVDIPVVGYGETAMHLSAFYGRRFGLLCFMQARQEFWADASRRWGAAERFGGAASADVEYSSVFSGFNGPSAERDDVVARIIAAGERFVREREIDVIIPSEMPLNLLLALVGVSKIGGATVIDGVASTFKMAEMLVDLKRGSGMSPSQRGYFNAHPDPGRVDQVMNFYGVNALGQRIVED